MTKYDKLVRDLIPDIIRSKGCEPKFHFAAQAEYEVKLREKLDEEVREYLGSGDPEELADIQEVVHALAGLHDYTPEQLEAVRLKKATERGGFKERIILEEA
jgi:predicted house-cleaning noncanonical NTP pyrophosphatase (MazG superfamily)